MLQQCRGVMVIVVENGHGDMSSNPGRDCYISPGKGMNPTINRSVGLVVECVPMARETRV